MKDDHDGMTARPLDRQPLTSALRRPTANPSPDSRLTTHDPRLPFSSPRPLDSSTPLIACLLSEREAAIRGEELAGGLFAAVEEIAELPDGYGYRFAGDDESQLGPLLEFIAAERRCCPFLTFELAFTPHHGPLWLRMRGSPEVKAFIAEAFNSRVARPLSHEREPGPALT